MNINLVHLVNTSLIIDQSPLFLLQDVGQAILESYSRVLESLAFRIVAWIDDVLFVDASVKKRLEAIQKT